jgi:hypothetical protein
MHIRKRFTYANIVATLALVFAMSGGALAASKYLITSTKQISPKVIKKLKGKAGPSGKEGPAGKEGQKGERGELGPSKSYQDQDTSLVIPEPGGGLGTAIDSLTLPAGTYLVTATGTITRTGLSAGQGATQEVQLRRGPAGKTLAEDERVVELKIECEQGSTGGATATYSITRLVKVTGTETISLNAYDATSDGTKSTAEDAALTATEVTEGVGAA